MTVDARDPVPSVPPGSAGVRDLAADGGVLGFAAAIWSGWGQEAPPAEWVGPLTVLAMAGLVVTVLAALVSARHRRGGSAMADVSRRRRYLRVVVVEVIAIVIGAVVLGVSGRSDYLALWILFVVGIHFVPLGQVFRITSLMVAGVVVTLVAVGAAWAGVSGWARPSADPGAGGGLAMVLFGALVSVASSTAGASRHGVRVGRRPEPAGRPPRLTSPGGPGARAVPDAVPG
jgi:hypothetical protein